MLTPNYALTTKRAREVLPAQVPFRDAVSNMQRVALLLCALESEHPQSLREAMLDKLHQPYRKDIVPGLAELLELEHPKLLGVCLSGAGPSLLALTLGESAEVKQLVEETYRRTGNTFTSGGLRASSRFHDESETLSFANVGQAVVRILEYSDDSVTGLPELCGLLPQRDGAYGARKGVALHASAYEEEPIGGISAESSDDVALCSKIGSRSGHGVEVGSTDLRLVDCGGINTPAVGVVLGPPGIICNRRDDPARQALLCRILLQRRCRNGVLRHLEACRLPCCHIRDAEKVRGRRDMQRGHYGTRDLSASW